MAIFVTESMMMSDRTPETARRTGADTWCLSWLNRPLTKDQAYSGMRLDETLSDPEYGKNVDGMAEHVADLFAADLGLRTVEAAALLFVRVLFEDVEKTGGPWREPGPPDRLRKPLRPAP